MDRSGLLKRFPELTGIPEENLRVVHEHLRTAPEWLLQKCTVTHVLPNVIFIRESEPAGYVYLLADGNVKAIDYRVLGFEYEYVQFSQGYAFGAMEIIMDQNLYCTTLKTVNRCMFIKVPVNDYAEWLNMDIAALKYESKCVGEYLLEQGRLARAYLFLPAPERLAKVLVGKYDKYERGGVLIVNSTRQELSNEAGFGIRTITRAVKTLVDGGYITKNERGIQIDREQYERLKELINGVLVVDNKLNYR